MQAFHHTGRTHCQRTQSLKAEVRGPSPRSAVEVFAGGMACSGEENMCCRKTQLCYINRTFYKETALALR
jgi:hypothetical protein